MKKLFLIQLCALLLIVFTAAASAAPQDDKSVVAELLETRIGILSYYYGGKMTFEDARQNLSRITADGLFQDDTALLEGFLNTEVDQIADYNLKVLSCHRTSYGIIKGKVHIYWMMHGSEGYWETEEEYYFTAECDAEGTKLTQLKNL